MKVLNSHHISPFGGLNFVLSEFDKAGIGQLLSNHLPKLASQSKYNWKDIFYSFWSVMFCGGSCAEDLAINFRKSFQSNPFMKIPSPDRVLERMKDLSEPMQKFNTPRGKKEHEFSLNDSLNRLNIKLLKRLSFMDRNNAATLDYDNTLIFSNKSDAKMTYKKQFGYAPGVGIIGKNIVYIENRNGNSTAETLQQNTLRRMFDLFNKENIKIKIFRADGASYYFSTLLEIDKNVDKFFLRARMSNSLSEAIKKVEKWEEVKIDDEIVYRGSVEFIPFEKIAKREKKQHLLKKYRLVITKIKRNDGQYNLFTEEPYNYRAILTNDYEKTNDEVVLFYNQRGAIEREFDVLKNDFAWDNMPFSKLEYNTVFLLITAMCRNLYNFIINRFSKIYANLSSNFRLKKFIYRFMCIPAKWIKTGRVQKLRIYGNLYFKT